MNTKHRDGSGVALFGLGLALAVSQVVAGPAAGPATEVTQLANNIQLVNQYRKQIEQTLTQVRQYEAQLLALRRLAPSRLDAMMRDSQGLAAGTDVLRQIKVIGELNGTLDNLSRSMAVLANEGTIALDTIALMRDRGVEIGTNDYARLYTELATVRQDTYGRRYQELTQAVRDAEGDIARMNAIAATAPEIQTNVEGFGALLQSNAVVVSQLGGVRQSLATAAAAQTEASSILADEQDQRRASKLVLEAWANAWNGQSEDGR